MKPIDRRTLLAGATTGALGLWTGLVRAGEGAPARKGTVRDRLWLWCHAAGAHTRTPEMYGLPGQSRITPAEAATYLGLRNVLMVRHGDDLLAPTPECARTVADRDRVVWSIEGGGGADVEGVLGLRPVLPNLCGVIMDDYFGRVNRPEMWLAANSPAFPVTLTVTLPAPLAADRLEVVQSAWSTGDYLSKDFVVEVSAGGTAWREVGRGTLPATGGASAAVALDGAPLSAFRLRLLNTHDTDKALSCGLTRVRLLAGGKELPLAGARAEATSEYPGHPAAKVLLPEGADEGPFSLPALRRLRARLRTGERPLDLWVVLYTGEFGLSTLKPHLDLCDVVTMWTWTAEELANLEANFARFDEIVGPKRKVLGLYLWDYGEKKPMSVGDMERQCRLGFQWLKQGRIEGMIFLASCICDLGLEAVGWTRDWIAANADARL